MVEGHVSVLDVQVRLLFWALSKEPVDCDRLFYFLSFHNLFPFLPAIYHFSSLLVNAFAKI
jgi:hypothetical protein